MARDFLRGLNPQFRNQISPRGYLRRQVSSGGGLGVRKGAKGDCGACKRWVSLRSTHPTLAKCTNLDEFAKEDVSKERLELASRRALDTLNIMTEIFIPKDDLLSSSGIVPVYYWFVRELFPESAEHVREFLVRFETIREENRELQKLKDERNVDAELSRYDTLNRSTNDATSHVERVKILTSRYRDWKESRQNTFASMFDSSGLSTYNPATD